MLETWTSGPFQRELERLDGKEHPRILIALRRFALGEPVDVRPVSGSAYPGTIRLRVGPHRLLGCVLPGNRIVYWTTVFRKRRREDYRQALVRHEVRMRDNPDAPSPHNP